MRISVVVSGLGQLFREDLGRLVEMARIADDAGVHSLSLPDHLAIGPRTDRYPYGRFPLPPDEPWLEPLTALAALAGATRRVRLATGVLIAPLRPALLLAKSAATLDVLSRGRLDLGVGVGWQREEYEAAGVPFARRYALLDETLRTCREAWSGRLGELHVLPRPVQAGGIPLWFGMALSDATVRRIARHGRGWLPLDPKAVPAGVARLRAAFAEAGRDPGELEVRAPARALDELPALEAAGATQASLALAAHARRFEEIPAFFESVAKA